MFKTCKKPPMSIISASGSICTFNALQEGLPLKSHTVNLVAKQAAGTPSPSSPLPISGWDAINIFGVGGNAWNEETRNGYYHASGGYYVNVAGQLCCKTPIDVLPNTTYRFCKPNTQGDVLFYDENGTYLNQYVGSVPKNGTFTTPSGCYKININLGNNYGATYNDDVIIAYPAGDKITIQIGSTIYGGTYDAITGILTVTHGVVDLSSLSWVNVSNAYFRANIIPLGAKGTTGVLVPFNGLCSYYKVSYLNDTSDNIVTMETNATLLYTRDNSKSTMTGTEYKEALTGQKLVYELATPQEIQLSPAQILTLKNNNIWADTGATLLQYIKIGR